MISITHLKSAFSENDSYEKQTIESESIEIDDDDEFDFYEVKKIIVKRKIYFGRKRRRKALSQFKMK